MRNRPGGEAPGPEEAQVGSINAPRPWQKAADFLQEIKDCLAAEKDARAREAIVFALGEIGRESLRAGGFGDPVRMLVLVVHRDQGFA